MELLTKKGATAAFASLGITQNPARKRGRAPAATEAAPAKRRLKASDGMTGEQFLLALLANEKLSTADVNRMWKASGRKNNANTLLGELVKDGKVKRAEAKAYGGACILRHRLRRSIQESGHHLSRSAAWLRKPPVP